MLVTYRALARLALDAPHHPHVGTFPAHFHDGDETTIVESHLSLALEAALRQVLDSVRQRLV